ncbi:MAG: DNA ligase D [Acidobacteria bacterium RIFCSPLOWO2_02_FULL_65_29]|nr:MAG: DNA ligase D [Acidobacteria bacterium RIFCSPLOWO2_02_FULL_65_29]
MLEPMLASLQDAPLVDPELVYEPKYDGIRAIAEVPAGGRVRLWSRLGNEKTSQFRDIAEALETWARARHASVVLDGEIVALDDKGAPTGFQHLQGRINLGGILNRIPRQARDDRAGQSPGSAAFIAFDVLKEGEEDLRGRPLTERRAALERLFKATGSRVLRSSEQVRGDGRALYKRALASGWEGLIAKRADSRYRSGKRTPDWRKLKILREQEFVIGGWTEPRQSRTHFGSLILGVYEQAQGKGQRAQGKGQRARGADLVYVGHVGTGFDERELGRLGVLLDPLETTESPFREPPSGNETPHWVKPTLVVQVKFTEWTADGILRHPVYLGLRDDKKAVEIRRETGPRFHEATKVRLKPDTTETRTVRLRSDAATTRTVVSSLSRTYDASAIIAELRALEDRRGNGTIELPGGDTLAVTNLHKVFWPTQKLTKGDLLRYYAQVAPFILPAVADRPLVMKRLPDGITGQTFYQHRAPEVPPGVRVETVGAATPEGKGPRSEQTRPQIVGGNLKTLLYMAQLASISQDPWFSRVQSPEAADHAALDLDPMPGVAFARVLDVARWIRDELRTIGASGFAKTSGADGLHIYIPLRPDTPYEAGLIFCQIIATVVANKHPAHATVERAVRARGQRVYVDCLQNIQSKTLATAYSARASDYAGVSTPLTWKEVDEGVRREDFTMRSVPARLEQAGDLWAALRKAKGVDLSRVARYAKDRG